MSQLRMAIIGACYSRDLFNSKILPGYQKYFLPVFHQNQLSMISLNAESQPLDEAYLKEEQVSALSPFARQQIRTEFSKSFLQSLIISQPDYILVDFYGDALFGAAKYQQTWITNKESLFNKLSLYPQVEQVLSFSAEPELYMERWEQGLRHLMEVVKKHLPNSQVILNPQLLENNYFDDRNELAQLTTYFNKPDFPLAAHNQALTRMNERMVALYPEIKVLNFNKRYYLDMNHLWGPWYLHFQRDYYEDFRDQLLGMAIGDMQQQSRPIWPKKQRLNLAGLITTDSLALWSYVDPRFKSAEGAITFASSDLTTNFAASWSQAIHLAKTPGQLTFSCEIWLGASLSQENVVFSFREFNNMEPVQAKFAQRIQDVTIAELGKVGRGRWQKVKLPLAFADGNFLKIGLSSKEAGEIRWKNIALTLDLQS